MMLMKRTVNRKWYKTPWKLIVLISILVITIFFVSASISERIFQNTEIRHHTINAGGTLSLGWDGRLPNSTTALQFGALENSIYTHVDDEFFDTTKIHERIISFEAEHHVMSIFSGESAAFSLPFSTRQSPNITLFVLRTDGIRFSDPIYFWIHDIETTLGGFGIWYNEDRIARDVIISHFRGEITSLVNDGIMLLYGVAPGEIPQTLSILGYEPDVFIPFVNSTGESSFLWYYYDMSKLSDILEAHIDFSSFTLAEVIDLLDIQIVP